MSNTMSEIEKDVNFVLDFYLSKTATCAERPVIEEHSFYKLSVSLSEIGSLNKSSQELLNTLKIFSKRYSSCGANNSEKYAVIRKPKTGWVKLIDKLLN